MSARSGQASALVWLRFTLWRRRLAQDGAWGRVAAQALVVAAAAAASVFVSWGLLAESRVLARDLAAAQEREQTVQLWLTLCFGARAYLLLVARGASGPLLEPRTFLPYAVPPALVSAINFAAQLLEPGWLVVVPPLVAIAFAAQRLHVAPAWAMLPVVLALVLLAASLVQLGAVLLAAVANRRTLTRLLVFAAALGVALAVRGIVHAGPSGNFPPWVLAPAGVAIHGAQALARGEPWEALWPLFALLAPALVALGAAHTLSLREARRPEAAVRAASPRGASGWTLPLLPGNVSALVEKEAKTLLRAGALQLVLAPVLLFVLRFSQPHGRFAFGPQPLLVVAGYAHLGVLAYAANGFGYDLTAVRSYFLWPITPRQALAAKNAVAYAFSLALFAVMTALISMDRPLTREQLAVGLLAHAATFPLLATLGNLLTSYAPSPMRGLRNRRGGPGASIAGLRIGTLFVVAAAAWAPLGLSKLTGLPVLAAYLGELCAMTVAYGGLLAFSAHVFEARREQILRALAQED